MNIARIKIFAFLVVIILIFGCKPAPAQIDYIALKDIKPGMKGYGKTVFKGTRIEKFDITILGVKRNFTTGLDVILAKIDSGYPVTHSTSVIGGMSGSPVYVNDKIIGALAYGSAFSKEPVFAITPIEMMFESLLGYKRSLSEKVRYSPVNEFPENIIIIESKKELAKTDHKTKEIILKPLYGDFSINGLSEKAIKKINENSDLLIEFGNSGGSYDSAYPVPKTEPGSSVNAMLIKGDICAGGNGTLTYIKDDTILAFGHSMGNYGSVSQPFTISYVLGINSNYQKSFKYSNPIKDIGAVTFDSFNGIKSVLNKTPDLIPVSLKFYDSDDKLFKKYDCRAVKNNLLTPLIISGAIMDGISLNTISEKEQTVEMKFNYVFNGSMNYTREETTFFSSGNSADKAFLIFTNNLLKNKYEKIDLDQINIAVKINNIRKTADIIKITADKTIVSPGETVNLNIYLKPYGKNAVVKNTKIIIPSYSEKGLVRIAVGSVSDKDLINKTLFAFENTCNFKQYLNELFENDQNSTIMVKAVMPSKSLKISEVLFPGLTPLVKELWNKNYGSICNITNEYQISKVNTDWVLEQIQYLELTVVENNNPSDTDIKDSEENKDNDISQKNNFIPLNIFNTDNTAGKNTTFDESSNNNKTETVSASSTVNDEKKKKEADKKNNEASVTKNEKKDDYFPYCFNYFQDSSLKSLKNGKFESTAIDYYGRITLSYPLNKIFSSEEQLTALNYDPSNRSIIAANSDNSIIRIDKLNKVSEILTGIDNTFIISSICSDNKGNILIGTSPDGRLYLIDKNNDLNLLSDLPVNYIWKIKYHNGIFWIATGSPGRIYTYDINKNLNLYFDSGQIHVRDFQIENEYVLCCTAYKGYVIKVFANKKHEIIFQEDKPFETVSLSNKGDYYGAFSNTFVKVTNNEIIYTYPFDPEKYISCIQTCKNGALTGTAYNGKLYYYDGADNFTMLYDFKNSSVLEIIPSENNDFIILTLSPSSIYRLKMSSFCEKGIYYSDIFDAQNKSTIGNIIYSFDNPESSVSLKFRAGNTLKPDNSWSNWLDAGSFKNELAGRFFQYMALLSLDKNGKSPLFEGLKFFYRYSSKIPFINIINPADFESYSKKIKIEWDFSDANFDETAFNIFYSKTNSDEWKIAEKDLPVKLTKSEFDKGYNPVNSKQNYTWDISGISDGEYRIKLTAYNRYDPENKSLTATLKSTPFVICNTPPQIFLINKETLNGIIKANCYTKSSYCNIKSINYKIKGNTYPAFIKDRIIDSSCEYFYITYDKGEKEVNIEVIDSAGNKNIQII